MMKIFVYHVNKVIIYKIIIVFNVFKIVNNVIINNIVKNVKMDII